jgi:uncharacterized metal-binding protein YceD (DUF177 family)
MSGQPLTLEALVGRIPAGGKHFRVEAREAERHAIALALGIVEVVDLTADLEVRPVGAEAFAVRGTLKAVVVQTDVVTLEPVRQEVSEAIDLTLLPAEGDSRVKGRADPQPDLGAPEDERDVYRKGRIDLGAIVLEHLALGLDPYPRSPGTEFPGHIESAPEPQASPFAALAPLKRDPE